MILKLMDKSEIFVDAKEGQAIRSALAKSEAGFITVRGTTIKKTAIMKLEEGGTDPFQGDMFNPKALIDAPTPGCRGEHSINRELMRVASKTKQFRKLGDPKWREVETKRLLKSGRKFCDVKTGECACEKAVVA